MTLDLLLTVDYMIWQSDVSVSSALVVEPNTIIVQRVNSISGAGKVDVTSTGSLDCVGSGVGGVEVTWVEWGRTGTYYLVGVPYSNVQYNIELEDSSEYEFRFCEFVGLGRAVVPSEESGVIRDCLFMLNTRGVDYQGCDGFEISNCLFVGNKTLPFF